MSFSIILSEFQICTVQSQGCKSLAVKSCPPRGSAFTSQDLLGGIFQESGYGGDTSSVFSTLTLYGLPTYFVCHSGYSLPIGGVLVVWLSRHSYISILDYHYRKYRMVEPKYVKMISQTITSYFSKITPNIGHF